MTIGTGLNINSNNGASSLTINSTGDINTNGSINATGSITTASSLNSNSINVNGSNLTIQDQGVLTTIGSITASGNLSIGSNYGVTASTGDVHTGAVTSTGSISVGGTSGAPNLLLGNDGTITAVNDLNINSSKFFVTAATGAVSAAGDLAINSNKFTVSSASGNVSAAGTMSVLGNLSINSGKFTVAASSGNVSAAGTMSVASDFAVNTNKFTVAAVSGNVSAAGDLAINTNKFTVASASGNVSAAGTMSVASDLAINTNKFTVVAVSGNVSAAGDLAINTNKFTVSHTDGKTTSAIDYSSYTPADCATNTTTTSASGVEPSCVSATSAYLTTQEYVDKQIWSQTKRINTILGTDSTVVDSFNNVYKLVTSFAGVSDTVDTLNNINGKYDTLVDRAEEITTSVSTVVAQAYNSILVNCTPTVWQDECGPLPIPSPITTKTIEDGWYFKNFSATEKINWYMPTNGSTMTIGDIQNLYLNIFAASNISLPFITIYTAPKGDGHDYYAGWAGAKINYIFAADTTSSSANKSYCLYTKNKPMNVYNKTCMSPFCIQTANGDNKNNGTEGTQQSTIDSTIVSNSDIVTLITIQTSKLAAAENVEFVLNSLNVCIKTGTTSFTFSNASVVTNYLFNYFFKKNIDFTAYPSPAKQEAHASSYDAIYN